MIKCMRKFSRITRSRSFACALACTASLAPLEFVRAAPASGPSLSAPDMANVAAEMAAAANNFLNALETDQRRRASFLFRDAERRNFHFFPIPRRGMPFRELNVAQRQLGYALLSTALSSAGFAKTMTAMSLGQILREMEPDFQNPFRDSDQYFVICFGKPDPMGTWAWRFEGFHVSLNVTIVDGKAVVEAPSFVGAHPARVTEGTRKGLRALAHEEDIARRLATSLDSSQRKSAFFEIPNFLEETIGGFLTGNGAKIEGRQPEGIPASRLKAEQVSILRELVLEYLHRHRPEVAAANLAKIAQAGWDNLYFRWSGSVEVGQGHHYLIQGPTFIIEYDNTQDGANHQHCIWRDLENDFGEDSLRSHYQKHHRR